MNKKKFKELYGRILRGDNKNIKFNDACAFVEELGYNLSRQRGTSYKIYKMEGIPEIINLQNLNGDAKPYQIDDIRKVINKYKLGGGDGESE